MTDKELEAIKKETRWQLLADMEYYFGPYFDKPSIDMLSIACGLTTEEVKAAITAGEKAALKNDEIMDSWIGKIKKLFSADSDTPAAYITDQTGIPNEVVVRILQEKNYLLSCKDESDWYNTIFEAFGGPMKMFQFAKTLVL